MNRLAARVWCPPLYADARPIAKAVAVGVLPAFSGAFCGVRLGTSAAAYWAAICVFTLAGIATGREHAVPWEGGLRGSAAGAVFATALLAAHCLTSATYAALPSPPTLQILVAAMAGFALGAVGARTRRSATSSRLRA